MARLVQHWGRVQTLDHTLTATRINFERLDSEAMRHPTSTTRAPMECWTIPRPLHQRRTGECITIVLLNLPPFSCTRRTHLLFCNEMHVLKVLGHLARRSSHSDIFDMVVASRSIH